MKCITFYSQPVFPLSCSITYVCLQVLKRQQQWRQANCSRVIVKMWNFRVLESRWVSRLNFDSQNKPFLFLRAVSFISVEDKVDNTEMHLCSIQYGYYSTVAQLRFKSVHNIVTIFLPFYKSKFTIDLELSSSNHELVENEANKLFLFYLAACFTSSLHNVRLENW